MISAIGSDVATWHLPRPIVRDRVSDTTRGRPWQRHLARRRRSHCAGELARGLLRRRGDLGAAHGRADVRRVPGSDGSALGRRAGHAHRVSRDPRAAGGGRLERLGRREQRQRGGRMSEYRVARLEEIEEVEDEGRAFRAVRHHLGVTAFGVTAWTVGDAGARIINEHDESGGGEELYLVLNGHAVFELDGDRVDAPAGTFVFAPPDVKRTAFAEEAGTTIVAV